MLTIDVEIARDGWTAGLPDIAQQVRRVIAATFAGAGHGQWLDGPCEAELAVVLSDDAAVARLNQRYRCKAGATNVLSFPAAAPAALARPWQEGEPPLLIGDIVLAHETVVAEASVQGKSLADHLSHLLVHGCLHLLGHDHIEDKEAAIMEGCERVILAGLGIADPYAERPAARGGGRPL
ncbi:MAG: rRNA maturation RNase YbeY [Pseudomonadota bacterium]